MTRRVAAVLCFALGLLSRSAMAQGTWSAGPFMNVGRIEHTATLLPNGKVLIVGGYDLQGHTFSSAELYDIDAGTFTMTASLLDAQSVVTATLLPTGKVLVTGGLLCELYDPASGTWERTGSFNTVRYEYTSTLLANGKVLVAGGHEPSVFTPVPQSEVYDPSTGVWTPTTGALGTGRSDHTATLLLNGKVLVQGGYDTNGNTLASAELFDPVTGTWSGAGSASVATANGTATLLENGKVLRTGGWTGTGDTAVADLYDPAGGWTTTGPMADGRFAHTATLLPNGMVLVLAGDSGDDTGTAELYDPSSGNWQSAGVSMNALSSTATLLPGGKVLIAGGQSSSNTPLRATVFYNPGPISWSSAGTQPFQVNDPTVTILPSGTMLMAGGQEPIPGQHPSTNRAFLYNTTTGFTMTGPMNEARWNATATLLHNGKVLVTGGENTSGVAVATAELYDPGSQTWAPTGSMAFERQEHTATLLRDGRVLVAGGGTEASELYDPNTGTWSPTGSSSTGRWAATATLLHDGRVLEAGGGTDTCALYDPATGTWSPAGPLLFPRSDHTATLLPNGKVLVVGAFSPTNVAELYDPATNTWSATGSLSTPRAFHAATALLNGDVLVIGGNSAALTQSAAVERYEVAAGTWSPAGTLATARSSAGAALLPNGSVLVVGGLLRGGSVTSGEIYSFPFDPNIAITGFTSPLSYNATTTITGTGFGGGSQASSGTNQSSAVNFPIVRMQSLGSGRVGWMVPDPRTNFTDSPMTLSFSNLPLVDPGWQRITVFRRGVPGLSVTAFMACGPAVIAQHPGNATAAIGGPASFSVSARGAFAFQWRRNGVAIAGASGSTYTLAQARASDAGAKFDVILQGGCGSVTSTTATLTIQDSTAPTAKITHPAGGDYWTLSSATVTRTETITWSMSDNVEICAASLTLQYSNDGGSTYTTAPAGGGLPAVLGPGGSCTYPGLQTTSLTYTVPTTYPSGQSGSRYRIRMVVTDGAGNTTVAFSNRFFLVQPNTQVKTLILANVGRMISRQGISAADASRLNTGLQDLAAHPQVQGAVIDLGGVSSITTLLATWDADPANATKANNALFSTGGIHDYLLTSLLPAYPSAKYIVLVGDDRIIPMARMSDRTVLLPENNYTTGGDLTASSTVGAALAGGKYLSDDPMALISTATSAQLSTSLFLPDLAIGRLVETPQQILTTIATFIGQNGLLDLTLLNATTGHKVLVTGYDFLTNPAVQMRRRWKNALGVSTADGSLAPVNGSLIGSTWGLSTPSARATALRTNLAGNGGPRYGVMALSGHATHYEEGVPGTSVQDIQGLSTADIYGPDACNGSTAGSINLSGGIVYSLGCHGGLSVPGSCRTDVDHSLDLPETMMSRGVVAYIANSGYGWGLLHGIGYGGRLVQIFTEQITSAAAPAVGDVVRTSKQRYFMEDPRPDPYGEKTLMQWTLYGLPMYVVKTSVPGATASLPETEAMDAVRVTRSFGSAPTDGEAKKRVTAHAIPASLTQLTLSFDFTAPNVYVKHDSSGNVLPSGTGCGDSRGCYYTLNGLVDRGTGTADYPIQPYFIYDSRLSGTSQHGVLWKGGTYDEESNWIPVFAQLISNGGDGSNHGSTPRHIMIHPHAKRIVRGVDSPICRPTDLEINSLTVAAGEAVKDQLTDSVYSIARRYRNVDLEVFYFNDQTTPTNNCDRTGPALGSGPYGGNYHQVSGSMISWAVPASDAAGVWRVLVVYNTNLTTNGRGTWTPLELANDGSGTFRGTLTVTGTTRVTYVLQAVDQRGNITWLDYTSAQLPSSGVPLALPYAVDAALTLPFGAPSGFVAEAKTATSVGMTWTAVQNAARYDIYRSSAGTNYVNIGSSTTTAYTDNTAQATTAYLYVVKAVDASNVASPASNPALVTTILFTDPVLTPKVATVKAVHVTQLRSAVNAVRTLAGLGAYSFTDPTLTSRMIRAVHVNDLRNALNAARTALGLPALTFSEPTLTLGSTTIKAIHIAQLRDGL